jgi:ADP-ribose pyrophosphatase YjhB (NUDIX family)
MEAEDPLKNNEKKIFCINCGKIGHLSKKCLCPIISIGIICIKLNINDIDINSIIHYSKRLQNNYLFSIDEINKLVKIKNKLDNFHMENYDELIEYLLIRRKNSLNYVEFIRGKYDIYNLDYLQTTFNFITQEEKDLIIQHNFDYLWNNLWGENNISNEFTEAKEKFNMLKKGFYIKKNEIDLFISINLLMKDSYFDFNEPEWGFPKGRRNLREKNIECAKREFEEETGISEKNYNILNMVPVEEMYMAINNNKYKHIYYISQIYNNDTILKLDDTNQNQNIEVGNIKWMKFNEAFTIMREYNISKKIILMNTHLNIKYIIDNFKEKINYFLLKNTEKENIFS